MNKSLCALLVLLLCLFAGPALADNPAQGDYGATGGKCEYDDLINAIKKSESSGRPEICATTKKGDHCCGLYQFCSAEASQYGLTTEFSNGRWTMTSSVEAQENAMRNYTQAHINELRSLGAFNYVGQTDSRGVVITESGIIGGAHLGGVGGVMRYLKSGKDASDGNTRISDYMRRFGGFSTPAGGTGSTCGDGGQQETEARGDRLCDETIYANISAQVNGALAFKNDFVANTYKPPASVAQVANTPCMSRELQRISNMFAYMPMVYTSQIANAAQTLLGPISGIANKIFQVDMQAVNSAASFLPKMLNFQSMASDLLGNLLSAIGIPDAFSSQLCGLMLDMVLKYIQCEFPIQLPTFGFSLNSLLPNGCLGQALRTGLYAASNSSALKTLNQPVSITNGRVVPSGPTSTPQ